MPLSLSTPLKTVVQIVMPVFGGTDGRTIIGSNPVGTGFIYASTRRLLQGSREDLDGGKFSLWLVTCRHVVTEAQMSSNLELAIRLNRADRLEVEPISLDDIIAPSGPYGPGIGWYLHPYADVAVMRIRADLIDRENISIQVFVSDSVTIDKNQAIDSNIGEGEPVFLIGFPSGWRPGRRDYPIVRDGILAQIEGWKNDDHKTLLIDGSAFPGNSGGPVLLKNYTWKHDGEWVNTPALIGVVSARTAAPGIAGGIETGDLVVVEPVDAIEEAIAYALQLDFGRPDEIHRDDR